MSDVKLGQLAPPEGKRDAVHVAVVAVECGPFLLSAGVPIVLRKGKAWPAKECGEEVEIGVVDPFLKLPVMASEWFWLFLKPGTVSNLRHSWAHPLFPDPEVVV